MITQGERRDELKLIAKGKNRKRRRKKKTNNEWDEDKIANSENLKQNKSTKNKNKMKNARKKFAFLNFYSKKKNEHNSCHELSNFNCFAKKKKKILNPKK